MHALVNYDVTDKHPEVNAGLQKLGYFDYWTNDEDGKKVRYNLPDTTLWKRDTELGEGLKDIQGVIATINKDIPLAKDKVVLKRCIVTSVKPWVAIPGSTDRP